METLTNSRFITHPDVVDKSNNHTVILIDATAKDIEIIGLYLKVSKKNFDVYLYRGDLGDLEWLSYVNQRADHVIINADNTSVKLSFEDTVTKYGNKEKISSPLEYFKDYDEQ